MATVVSEKKSAHTYQTQVDDMNAAVLQMQSSNSDLVDMQSGIFGIINCLYTVEFYVAMVTTLVNMKIQNTIHFTLVMCRLPSARTHTQTGAHKLIQPHQLKHRLIWSTQLFIFQRKKKHIAWVFHCFVLTTIQRSLLLHIITRSISCFVHAMVLRKNLQAQNYIVILESNLFISSILPAKCFSSVEYICIAIDMIFVDVSPLRGLPNVK